MIAAVKHTGTKRRSGRARAWALASSLASSLAASVACGSDDGPPAQDSSAGSGTASGTLSGSGEATASSGGSSMGETTHADASTGEPMEGWAASLEVGDETGAFFSVWGPEPSLVYAAAGQPLAGGLSRGALWRWDGQSWSTATLPADVPGLNWVFGVGTRRVIVGELGVILMRDGDEGEWIQQGCGTVLPLWGVWGAAVDDVWAVGGDGFNRDPIACHFDGRAWTRTDFPDLAIESHALYKVWGTASDDVWAVGDAGLLLHYRGPAEGWVEVPSGTDSDLISLWGRSPDDILAVGGRTTAVLSRYDGAQWTTQQEPALPGLNGVWMAPDGTSTVVGPQGGLGLVAAGALSVEVEEAGTGLALHGVYGFPGVERWAVGGSLDMAPPYVGVILHHTQ